MLHARSPRPASRLVHDFRNGGEIVRGNTVALAGMAVIEVIVPPLDDGKLAPSCDEQMSATTFLDDADGHILRSLPRSDCSGRSFRRLRTSLSLGRAAAVSKALYRDRSGARPASAT